MRVVVGRVSDFANGDRKIVDVNGKSVGVFRIDDAFYALRNRCPHQFGPLCLGTLASRAISAAPGDVTMDAGPHVKVLVQDADRKKCVERMKNVPGVLRVIEASPGDGATVVARDAP